MSAAAVILSAPQGWGKTRRKHQLQVEYNCHHVIDDWHPRMGLCPGALHLTSMHPGDLEDYGIAPEAIQRRGWPCQRDLVPASHVAVAQAGHIFAPLLSLMLSIFGAVLMAAVLASSFNLDTLRITDHSTELAVAQDLEDAQREEARRARMNQVYRAICGNAEWEELPGGAVRCLPRKGIRPHTVQLAGAQP